MATLEITIKTGGGRYAAGGTTFATVELEVPAGIDLASYSATVVSLATKALVPVIDKAPRLVVERSAEEMEIAGEVAD